MRHLWMCIDSTPVIWCLRGNTFTSSQWAFVRCQEVIDTWDTRVSWSPDPMGITGNEVAGGLADLEAHNPNGPSRKVAEPTVTGL